MALFVALSLAVVVLFSSSVGAVDYEITIDDSTATKNQNIIFQYDNIGPGFSSDAPVRIINQATSTVEVKLIDVQPVNSPVSPAPAPANNLLPYVNLALLRSGVTISQGSGANMATLIGATICVPAETTEELMTRLTLPSSVGNEAQNTSLWLEYTFQITTGPCEIVTPPDPGPGPTLPETGETMLPFMVLGGLSLAGLIVALVIGSTFLIPLLFKGRKGDERV
jgi:LPXTG-motif cell wall-anchored protein